MVDGKWLDEDGGWGDGEFFSVGKPVSTGRTSKGKPKKVSG